LMPSMTPVDPTSWSTADWIKWRDSQIRTILEPTLVSGGELVLSRDEVSIRAARAYETLEPLLKADPKFLSRDPALNKELANFTAFLRAQHWMQVRDSTGKETHVLGLEMTDDDYWKFAEPYVKLPELLRSQPFLDAMRSPQGYQQAINLIEAHNKTLSQDKKWTVLPFMARFILSVDRTTYGRLLVFVPDETLPDGSTLDRWIQFAIATPIQIKTEEIQSVSIVAVRRNVPPNGTTSAYMVDYMRHRESQSGQIDLVPTMKLPHNPSKNCYDCHKSPALPIRPETEYVFDTEGHLVPKTVGVGETTKRLNTRIRAYGNDQTGVQDLKAYGPSIGPASRQRSDDYVRALVPEMKLTDAAVAKIKGSMKCSSCHDSFAPLNYLLAVRTNRDEEAFKDHTNMVQTYVKKGWMPPGNTLSPTERSALWKCLSREYFDPAFGSGVFVDWLKGSAP